MAYTIAFAGKGGTGKTSLASLTIRFLVNRKRGVVLAVDADPNSCMDQALGVTVHATVGQLREDSLNAIRGSGDRPGGMSMEQLFDFQVQSSVIESEGFDLLVMGRPEGPGCYCAANNIIRKYTDKLSESYHYVVIDNEAGMEHLSRRTTNKVSLLIIVSDPTVRGIKTARRLHNLVAELHLDVDKRVVVINKSSNSGNDGLVSLAQELGIEVAGLIPYDDAIAEFDHHGRAVYTLREDSKAVKALSEMLDSLKIP
jgi:CO dehydrogenase maturation factor